VQAEGCTICKTTPPHAIGGLCERHRFDLVQSEWEWDERALIVDVSCLETERTYRVRVAGAESPRLIAWAESFEMAIRREPAELSPIELSRVALWVRRSSAVDKALRDALEEARDQLDIERGM